MKNKKILIGIIAAILLCAAVILVVKMSSGKEPADSEVNSLGSSSSMSITSNEYANDEESRIIADAQKNGSIVYEGEPTIFEDSDTPGNVYSITINN